jgi:hypothetical protein
MYKLLSNLAGGMGLVAVGATGDIRATAPVGLMMLLFAGRLFPPAARG